MRKNSFRIAVFLVFIAAAFALRYLILGDYLTAERLKEERYVILFFVNEHYAASVAVYVMLYIITSFLLPGTIILTMAGGFLFGVTLGAIYTVTGITMGSSLAFLASRHLIGGWVQRTYSDKLERFNSEMEASGHLYLLTLRIAPVLPAFVTNYLAGFTAVTLRTFIWTTFLGVIPGSVIYSYAGMQLKRVESIEDFLSARVTLTLLLMAVLALLPVAARYFRERGA